MRLRAPLLHFFPVVLLVLGAGCGGGERDATAKQLDELRAEVARLRASQAALAERLDTVDIERGAFAKGAATAEPVAAGSPLATPRAPAQAADRDRPELDVVRLSPSEGDGDADNSTSRPVIRAVGDSAGPRPTLSNKTLGTHAAPKKGVLAALPKKAANDAPPGTKP
jgi:hypothetical protein